MDENEKLRQMLQNMPNLAGDQDSRKLAQDIAVEKVKRAQMAPDDLSAYDAQLGASVRQPTDRSFINPTPTQVSPEQQALLERRAMESYNSPEAQAIRARFGGEPQREKIDLSQIAGLLNKKPKRSLE